MEDALAPEVVPPDWSAVPADVACPLCGYNLRGLTEPRCPECGYGFAWAELLSAPPTHPYLFECQPRRNVPSFVRTQLGGFLPRRFWRTLRPEVPVHRQRLIVYWILSVSLLIAGAAAGLGQTAWSVRDNNHRRLASVLTYYAQNPQITAGRNPSQWAQIYDPPVTSLAFRRQVWRTFSFQGASLATVAFLCWPWLTFAALQVFAASMRKARVRRWHVLRCAIYCCDFGLVAGAAIVLLLGAGSRGRVPAESAMRWFALPLAAYVTYRLGTAYRLYLRFDRPYLAAAASQVIVFLIGFKGALWAMGY